MENKYVVIIKGFDFLCVDFHDTDSGHNGIEIYYRSRNADVFVGKMMGIKTPEVASPDELGIAFEQDVEAYIKEHVVLPIEIIAKTDIKRLKTSIVSVDVKNDYIDDDNYTHIDLYEGEEGRTIALVCNDTNKFIFIDNGLQGNLLILEAIEKVVKRNEESIRKNIEKIELKIKNEIFTFSSKPNKKIIQNAGMFLSGDDNEIERMIQLIRSHENQDDLIDMVDDDVTPCQAFEFSLTCKDFLEKIQNYLEDTETGYYAIGKDGNLYQFEWKDDDSFHVLLNKKYVKQNPDDYTIREVEFLTADS